ncbi:DUF4424 family protein [Sphingomonas sp. ASY06-1R]|uniref:DUF4424 family protein n=1 Tax=Sphingomonas sp. ASY06-1R TaxID=3445771 RepID=UPI003FA2027A
MNKLMSLALGALLVLPALANDSTAEMGAGGLVLRKTDAIDMVAEDLYVSPNKVRVSYVFHNRTDKDVHTVVGFPMPDEDLANRDYGDVAYPHDFVTRVAGKPVTMALEVRAVLNGKDHTAMLAPLKVPLEDPDTRLNQLARADQDRLLALGLATQDGGDRADARRHLVAAWTVRRTYHWTQLFPAGRELAVEHIYVPGTGGSIGTALTMRGFRSGAEGKAYIARYCTDAAFLAGVDKFARAAGAEYAALPEVRVQYILTTGANWRAPIGNFSLVVDKGAPENLISFCADGVRKISPTRFEVRHSNWRPNRDLDILIIKPRH